MTHNADTKVQIRKMRALYRKPTCKILRFISKFRHLIRDTIVGHMPDVFIQYKYNWVQPNNSQKTSSVTTTQLHKI